MDLEKLKFPIGKYIPPAEINSEIISTWIESIARFPKEVEKTCTSLTNEEKNWIYRPGGWSIKQVVHHCADSHLNSICRFKLALTENNPTIRPYEEQLWAELIDGNDDDISNSILLLTGLHAKWVKLLKNLSESELKRTYIHPAQNEQFDLAYTIGNYAWHCEHHLAHIKQALRLKNSF